MFKVSKCILNLTDIDLHDYIFFTYSDEIRDQQLLENGANGKASGYRRAAGNKMAIWERIRKGRAYDLVKVLSLSDIPLKSSGLWNLCRRIWCQRQRWHAAILDGRSQHGT